MSLHPKSDEKFSDCTRALELIRMLDPQDAGFAVVHNPGYIHPPYELYPLAPFPQGKLARLSAVVCDMDGTTTTTEPLCLHSLEFMVRRVSGRPTHAEWAGLSHEHDYPHVIGNSTTRHIEYLMQTYGPTLRREAYLAALIEASLWTIAVGRDEQRRSEAREALVRLGLADVIDEPAVREFLGDRSTSLTVIAAYAGRAAEARPEWPLPAGADLVRGAIEIYYARYHQILQAIAAGQGASLAAQLMAGAGGEAGERLIKPMAGVELFLAVIRGLLPETEAAAVFDHLAPRLDGEAGGTAGAYATAENRTAFLAAAARLRESPLRVAVVTSSIRYEAEIVLGELFTQLAGLCADWPVSDATHARLAESYQSPAHYYDAIVTASDSSEIRLKPHRDLYSIALHRLGLKPEQFGEVIGLEDSEPGLIAIRAAGVGCAVAVPFTATMGHNLKAAFKVNHGGLYELMFRDHFFLG